MAGLPTAWAAGLALVVAILTHRAYIWYRLRHVPGPFWMSVSKLPMVKIALGGKYGDELLSLARQYGPIVRVGPNEVMLNDADSVRRMESVRSEYTKGEFYDAVVRPSPERNVFNMRDEEKRKSLKTRLTPGYSGRDFSGFEPAVDKYINEFIDLIERKYVSTATDFRPIEFGLRAQFFTLDVISYIAFSKAFGFLAEDRDLYQFLETIKKSRPMICLVTALPWLTSFVHRPPLSYLQPREGNKVGFGKLMGIAADVVEARLKPGAKAGTDMLQTHINGGLSRTELVQDAFLVLLAGSETTATAIRVILLFLMTAPQVYATLMDEIDHAVLNSNPSLSSAVFSDAEARKLPYLQAVIHESLRCHPPVTGLNYKQVPPGGDAVHGCHLPGGTQVGHNLKALTRDRTLFGEDADIFRPERWLEAQNEELSQKYKAMKEATDLVFGHGKFQCMGRPLALMELNKLFVELLRRYDFSLVNPKSPLRAVDSLVWVVDEYWVRITRRTDTN